MVNIDNEMLMNCVEWKTISKDAITIKVDGEKLRKEIYNEICITIEDNETYITLQSGNHDLIDITPGNVFNKADCLRIAAEMKNILNNRIKSKLEL